MIKRRDFLKFSFAQCALGTAALCGSVNAFAKVMPAEERRLSFYNLHTGEQLTTTYWVQGEYLAEELQNLDYLLRDHRTSRLAQDVANPLIKAGTLLVRQQTSTVRAGCSSTLFGARGFRRSG